MNCNSWKYYNHAVIPSVAPHEKVDIEPIKNGSIWKAWGGARPLFARWTSDFDCGYETNWYWLIRESPFILEELTKGSRKKIKKALENCIVERIDSREYSESLWNVYQEATERYKHYTNNADKKSFIHRCLNPNENEEYWAGFDAETHRMIGYKICLVHQEWVNFSVGKYSTEFLKLRVSDALNYVVLNYYLNLQEKRYVTDGERVVLHDTNVQEYLIEHFNFRKAYCHLHIKYRPITGALVKFAYPFRGVIQHLDNSLAYKLNAVLRMEEICRNGF